MSLKDVLPELLELNHDELVQAIEILQQQLIVQESVKHQVSSAYETWSPTITPETAIILQQMLAEDKEHRA